MAADDVASALSNFFGSNAKSEADQDTAVHTSATFNSFEKCIESLRGKFKAPIIQMALEMAAPHNADFSETKQVGSVYESYNGGEPVPIGIKVLSVKGTYKNAFIVHLKTIEMSILTVPA